MSWPVASAVRNGDAEPLEAVLDLAPLGVRVVGAASISRRYAADAPPAMCIEPQLADGHA